MNAFKGLSGKKRKKIRDIEKHRITNKKTPAPIMMEREWYEGKANKVAAVHKGNLAMFPNVHN